RVQETVETSRIPGVRGSGWGRLSLLVRLEGVLEVVVGDVRAERDAGETGEAIVEAGPDARVDDLGAKVVGGGEVLDGVEVAGRPIGVEAVDVEVEHVAEDGAEDVCHRSGDGAVRGGVLGMVRRHEE